MKKVLLNLLVLSLIVSQFTSVTYAKGKPEKKPSKSIKRDKDGNGISDEWQSKYHLGFGKNIALKDNDRDGLNNLVEFQLNLNPESKDTDKDRIQDGIEDNDKDALNNLQELKADLSPAISDTDNDGIKDSDEDNDQDKLNTKEEFIIGTNPVVSDSDKDGVNDGNEDKDSDSLTNELEFEMQYNPLDSDSDNDGIKDGKEDIDNDSITNDMEIKKLEVNIIADNKKKFSLEYELSENKSKMKIKDEIGLESTYLLQNLKLSSTMTKDELILQITQALGIENVNKLEIKVQFGNGKKIKSEVEIKNKDKDENDEDNDKSEYED
jgi:hypothetical protein